MNNPVESKGVIAPGGLLFGHPKGLFLVAGTEFWERFSYYGMLGLLVLYLTSAASRGGFGWSEQEAIRLYALYSGAAFIAPAIGGWLCGRYFGERFCILWGGVAVALGHVLLGGPGVIPTILSILTDFDIDSILKTSDVPLGRLFPSSEIIIALKASLHQSGVQGAEGGVIWAYRLIAWSFNLGLLLIIVGTGFIKSSVSSIVSRFYPGNNKQREAGFAIFMASIYLGSLSANFIAGTLGERLGWHYGFSAAAIGMCFGVFIYVLKQNKYLADIGLLPDSVSEKVTASTPLSSRELRRVSALLIMGAFTVLYAAAFYQKGGLLNIFTKNSVDRSLFGFEIPATWYLSISTGLFVVLAPLSVKCWGALERRGIVLSIVQKQAFGMLAIAIGYAFIVTGVSGIAEGVSAKISMFWIVMTYICFAVGDVLIWPVQLAAVGALAPARYKSFAIGAWYLTIGFGTWLTGIIGSYAYTYSLSSVLVTLCISCGLASLLLFALNKPISFLAK